MKQYLIIFLSILLFSCNSNNDDDTLQKEVSVALNFTHSWNTSEVTKSDLSTTEYTNKKDTKLSIDRLRYLISKITLTNDANKETVFDGYKLIDLSNTESLNHSLPQKILEGTYKVSITFGFSTSDNKDGIYQDLNSASWNVPGMLGGGYHYMQMDGKYFDKDNLKANFNYHAIRAVDRTDPNNLKFEDTSFIIDLGSVTIKENAMIPVNMNIAEWFQNPNEWDLNVLNTKLMPNFEAQKLMSANGKTVFSLGEITQ